MKKELEFIDKIIDELTIDEKISLLEGSKKWHTKQIIHNDKIIVPQIYFTDGPHGIRQEIENDDFLPDTTSGTLYPTESLIACSFDELVAYEVGKSISAEAKSKNINVVLAPGVNIKRHPLCGRNFEYFSEDPYLTKQMATSYLKGLQENGRGGCVKHFMGNNQEKYRYTIDAIIDERALREIYLPAFKACVEAGVDNVMCSYNKVNGEYTSENKKLLTDILRNEWNFQGILITDWGACNNRVKGLLAGQDLQMPQSNNVSAKLLKEAYLKNEITDELINTSIKRIITKAYQYQNNPSLKEDYDYEEYHQKARILARKSMVLLKNVNDFWPLNDQEKVLVISDNQKVPHIQGGGSSALKPYKVDTFEDILKNVSKNLKVSNEICFEDDFDKEIFAKLKNDIEAADKIIVFASTSHQAEEEGRDRDNLLLANSTSKYLGEILKLNENVGVVLTTGGVVEIPALQNLKGLLYAGLAGEASLCAIFDILYGKYNPSGRLAETFCAKAEDYITNQNFNQTTNAVWYQESIFVGYRYFTTFNKTVVFPFGYGLSYSHFLYHNLIVKKESNKITVSVEVQNYSKYAGEEVVLLFIENNKSEVYKAKRELRKFKKLYLEAGSKKTVVFNLTKEDFSYYEPALKSFVVNNGVYKIQIMKNANEVILEEPLEITSELPCDKFTSGDLPLVYNIPNDDLYLSDDDFILLMKNEITPKNVKKVKPYNQNSLVLHLKKGFYGKIIYQVMMKMMKKQPEFKKDKLKYQQTVEMLQNLPLRMLISFSKNVLTNEMLEGLLEIANGKLISGLKKFKKTS